jgi:hypothetical protein
VEGRGESEVGDGIEDKINVGVGMMKGVKLMLLLD